jgi:hypothetical protein
MEPGCSISTITGSDKRDAPLGARALTLPAIASKVVVPPPATVTRLTFTQRGLTKRILFETPTSRIPGEQEGGCY